LASLTSNLGSLFIFAKTKSTFYLGWQKKNFYLGAASVICIFKKSGGPFRGGAGPFCVLGIKRANLSTSTQLSLTKISTFCIKN
jgi:hypothetical protein